METVWTWGGEFFGYIDQGNLFTHAGKCVGRIQNELIYGKSGEYLGEVMQNNRLITNMSKSSWRGSPAYNIAGSSIVRYANYAGYAMYAGHEDFPSPDNL